MRSLWPPSAGRLLSAFVLATVGVLFFATRVFTSFEPLRIKAVQDPTAATAGRVDVTVAHDRVGELRVPWALIARIRNEAPVSQEFVIRLDGATVCSTTLRAGSRRRIDCGVTSSWTSTNDHLISIGATAPWTLEYLELATHHGNSTGIFTAFILPDGSRRFGRAGGVLLATVWIALAMLFAIEPRSFSSPTVRTTARALTMAIAVLFVAVALIPALSPYLVVLSPWTFAAFVLLATLSRTWPVAIAGAPPLVAALRRSLGSARAFLVKGTRAAGAAARAFWTWSAANPVWLVWTFGALLTVACIARAGRAVGGSDEYGYVSQAELWLKGNLKIEQPFVRQIPWHDAGWCFAPLGYRPDPGDPGVIVPVYSPGLPMLLALAKRVGGQEAMFWVVPLSFGLLVLSTLGIGRRLGDDAIGLIGAWLVATSPVVLLMSVAPMTDVPVAAAWAAAFYFLLGTTATTAALAGFLSALAVLIRPNLAPLAVILAMRYALDMRHEESRRTALSQLIAFSTAVLPGVVAIALINANLYGSPFSSGYGKLPDLFAFDRLWPNLKRYLGWFAEAHTPVAFCGFVAILIPLRELWPSVRDRTVFVVIAGFVLSVWAIYCAWLVFDAWWFTRLLLSSWPFIMLGVGAVAVAAYRFAGPYIRPLVVCAVIALGIFQLDFALEHRTFNAREGRRRFVAAARLVRRLTDENSVVISGDHSGSLRYYGGRMTMNYVWIPAGSLDGILAWLKARGVKTYLAAEHDEIAHIRRRFDGSASLQVLDAPPLAISENPGRMLLFDLTELPQPGRKSVIERDLPIDGTAGPVAPPALVLKEES